ncbi:Dyp-type peroxidase [Cellulomonas composti]|uniref:Iron-dependent peroxidase n=1 Tax=Cellulomonas composti TaxID=266130 RepID=A0A511JBI6_9CELL|nr:Dyp-type peroxidase [Cellulomonas composti]GEL95324.1 iron-dependent peroxidase [Cellulomonas composti]
MTESQGLSRRALLAGAGTLVAGAGIATIATSAVTVRDTTTGSEGGTGPGASLDGARREVEPAGSTQAGVARPTTPAAHALFATFALPDLTSLRADLAALGRAVLATVRDSGDLLPDGRGDLTVTIGLGPRPLASVDPSLPGATPMPDFVGDDAIPSERRDPDLLVAVAASDATMLRALLDRVTSAVPGLVAGWTQHGFRAPGTGTVARNPLGYLDGIIVPDTTAELAENVWITQGALAGATVCVLRRLRLDSRAFLALEVPARDATIGRGADGVPLSGGSPTSQVDLDAKTPEGEYLVPARAHARAAHPSFTGSPLMLRRGYAFDDGEVDGPAGRIADAGLLFACYQRTLDTFVRTQQRLDETDDLMAYATPTGSASFLVLPGYDDTRPLGDALFA